MFALFYVNKLGLHNLLTRTNVCLVYIIRRSVSHRLAPNPRTNILICDFSVGFRVFPPRRIFPKQAAPALGLHNNFTSPTASHESLIGTRAQKKPYEKFIQLSRFFSSTHFINLLTIPIIYDIISYSYSSPFIISYLFNKIK